MNDYYGVYSKNDYRYYLQHHGIKGQSWGVKNGPPYPLSSAISTGRALRDKYRAHKERAEARKQRRLEKQYTRDLKKGVKARKHVKSMSDEELVAQINRLQLEKKYIDLQDQLNPQKSSNPAKVRKRNNEVKKFVLDVGKESAKNITKSVAKEITANAVNDMLKAMSGVDYDFVSTNKTKYNSKQKKKDDD